MVISPQVQAISEVLSAYAGGALHDPRMMERFLQHAQNCGRPVSLGELAFTGKYLTRLQGTMRQQTSGTELYDKLEQEFSRAIHDFHAKVGDFIKDAEGDVAEMVRRQVLAVSENALRNLMRLAEDFTWLKNWELDMMQNEGGTGAE